jgi:hypothetical protein
LGEIAEIRQSVSRRQVKNSRAVLKSLPRPAVSAFFGGVFHDDRQGDGSGHLETGVTKGLTASVIGAIS